MAAPTHYTNTKDMWSIVPPWPNGQGVGLLIRRFRVRVPQGVLDFQIGEEKHRSKQELGYALYKNKGNLVNCPPLL